MVCQDQLFKGQQSPTEPAQEKEELAQASPLTSDSDSRQSSTDESDSDSNDTYDSDTATLVPGGCE